MIIVVHALTPEELKKFHPLKDASRYRDPQLQVGENYSHLFNLGPNICQFWCFILNNCDLTC